MSAVKSNTRTETIGISPKVAWPSAILFVLGLILCALDLTGVADLEDEIWITLLASGPGVFAAGYSAPPALQARSTNGPDPRV